MNELTYSIVWCSAVQSSHTRREYGVFSGNKVARLDRALVEVPAEHQFRRFASRLHSWYIDWSLLNVDSIDLSLTPCKRRDGTASYAVSQYIVEGYRLHTAYRV